MGKLTRPRIALPLSRPEIILEAVALFGLLVLLSYCAYAWPSLPERIPTHFGIENTPDAWGGKHALLILPGVGTVLYLLLTIVGHFPHFYNYPIRITEENALRQYRLARMLVAMLKVPLIWMFAYLERMTVQVAVGNASQLDGRVMVIFLVALFGLITGYLILAFRQR
ncbi:MAG TPA: DUF1648 domain-containing protein [Armatimonadota bacterium]|jgi:uncharacterized membrane protein